MTKYAYQIIYHLLLVFRLIVPFTVFSNPILAIFLVLFGDTMDGLPAARSGIKKLNYQYTDKGFDLFWYFISLVYVLTSNSYQDYKVILIFLAFYRLVGVLLFWLTGNKKLLFIFANFYENIFFLVTFGLFIPWMDFVLNNQIFIILSCILILLKLVQEYVVHLAPYSFTERYLRIKLGWKE